VLLKRFRVLFAGIPKMLSDILGQVLASEPDMTIAGRIRRDQDLLKAVQVTRANVVLAKQNAEDERETYAPLLSRRPQLKVVAVAADGSTGLVYALHPQRVPLGEMSVETLRRAIRGSPQQ
jgi:DNA-binding NarL/FixJ family response regulator